MVRRNNFITKYFWAAFNIMEFFIYLLKKLKGWPAAPFCTTLFLTMEQFLQGLS